MLMVSEESCQQSTQPKIMIVVQLPGVTISIVTIMNSLLMHSHIINMSIDNFKLY